MGLFRRMFRRPPRNGETAARRRARRRMHHHLLRMIAEERRMQDLLQLPIAPQVTIVDEERAIILYPSDRTHALDGAPGAVPPSDDQPGGPPPTR